MIDVLLAGLPWIAGTAAAYRAALAMLRSAQPDTLRAKVAVALGGGGPGVRT